MPSKAIPSFSVIIVTYNNAASITPLLKSLTHNNLIPHKRIICVDNHSQDETVKKIQSFSPNITVIKNHKNHGFALAVNQATKLITTPYFFLINPDVIVPPDFFPQMLKYHQKPHLAAIGPRQFAIKNNHRINTINWNHTNLKALFPPTLNRNHPKTLIPATFLNAGCLLINTQAFNQVGGFNQNYFLYGEEPDLFLKFKRFGYKCYYLPKVSVIHQRDHSLHSHPPLTQISLRLRGAFNIIHALTIGYINLILSKI